MSATFVDIDGHITEPATLWQDYIDPEYRDHAIKISKDENGLEYVNVDGNKAFLARDGAFGALGAIGKDARPYLEPGRISWDDAMVPGGYIGSERAKVMDDERIDMTLVYPSLGLVWEYDCDDVKVAAANCRAYNDWVFDFCSGAPTRLVPVAHIPMADIDEAIKEMKRTAALGAKAMMMGSDCEPGRPYGHPYFDPLWEEAVALDMPMTIHPATGRNSVSAVAYPNVEDLTTWWVFLYGGETVKLNFSSFFNHGTFDRFPDLNLVILESGIGWLVWWLDRMDEKFEINGFTTPMKEIPSSYFKRQCFISMDPDERLAKFSIEVLGADRFMWAYDFPHSDSILDPVNELEKNLADLPEEDQQKVFGGNAIELYNLSM